MKRALPGETRAPFRGGLTLIELVAVIALLGLIASGVLVHLANADDDAALRSAAQAVRDLDRRARLHAQSAPEAVPGDEHHATAARILLRVEQQRDGLSSSIVLEALPARTAVARAPLPRGVDVVLRTDEGGGEIVFDRTGRSRDYTVEVRRGSSAIAWRIHGATGAHRTKEAGER